MSPDQLFGNDRGRIVLNKSSGDNLEMIDLRVQMIEAIKVHHSF
jgi:hypothetical protein